MFLPVFEIEILKCEIGLMEMESLQRMNSESKLISLDYC
jgi:hypothetical protein